MVRISRPPCLFHCAPGGFPLGYPQDADVSLAIRQTVGLNNPFLPPVTAVGAVICALNGFSYLHSRTKVDFWHSLPVRREMLFAVKYINGILIYLAAYAVNTVLTLGLFAARGMMTREALAAAYMSILVHATAYWLFYSVALATVFLTGHILVNLMGVAVFYLYGILVSTLCRGLMLTFFRTAWDGAFYNLQGILSLLGAHGCPPSMPMSGLWRIPRPWFFCG